MNKRARERYKKRMRNQAQRRAHGVFGELFARALMGKPMADVLKLNFVRGFTNKVLKRMLMRVSWYTPNGEQECERRKLQMARGIIPRDQIGKIKKRKVIALEADDPIPTIGS